MANREGLTLAAGIIGEPRTENGEPRTKTLNMSFPYTKEQTAGFGVHTFAYLLVEERDNVLTITLNRPQKKNALNPVMVNELAFAISYAHYHPSIRAVVIGAKGDVFCSGADLRAFTGGTEEHHSTIPAPPGEVLIGELLPRLHKPSIARVEGDVYAGGFLLLAGCTYVMTCNHIKLGLPEVKRGLFPFQVMAALMEVMPPRKVLDWCIRGFNLDVERARQWGLVTHVTIQENIDKDLDKLLGEILTNSPTAIRLGMEAFDHLRRTHTAGQHEYLLNMLMRTVQTKDAQEGMAAFREKRTPVWTGE